MAEPLAQPTDWTEPGAYPVAPGVHRIPLPMPVSGLRAVNVYTIDDPSGLVLVDGGWYMPESERQLATALGTLGYRIEDIGQFIVTHAHWDHYTQAYELGRRYGIKVRLGREEHHSIDGYEAGEVAYPRHAAALRRAGATALADEVDQWRTSEEEEEAMPFGSPDGYLDDRERISLRRGELEIVATPGHTRGHVVVRDAGAGLMFAGDHVLPHITPSIGLERKPEPMPLRSYLESLRLVRDMPDALLLPAHGLISPSVHTRIDELLAHHEARLDAAAHQIKTGAGTPFEVAAALPWTRRERKLADLDPYNQMLAILEMQAHLDVLVDQGVLTVATDGDGIRRFAVS